MRFLVCVTALLAASLFASTSPLAAEGWEVALKVKAGVAENKLSFGQRADATDGIDGRYDVPAMLAGDVQACFVEVEEKLWRDIKAPAPGAETVWEVLVETSKPGPVELSWSGAFPENATVTLVDLATGGSIDMRSERSYVFNNDGPRSLRIETVR